MKNVSGAAFYCCEKQRGRRFRLQAHVWTKWHSDKNKNRRSWCLTEVKESTLCTSDPQLFIYLVCADDPKVISNDRVCECVREVWGHDLSWHGKQRVFVTMYDVWRSHTSITSVKVILFYKTQFYEGSSVLQLFSLSVEILAVLQWTVLGSTAHFGHTQLVL